MKVFTHLMSCHSICLMHRQFSNASWTWSWQYSKKIEEKKLCRKCYFYFELKKIQPRLIFSFQAVKGKIEIEFLISR